MAVFIYVLIILVCVFLGLIVLIQNPKGGGLDSSFGAANQIGGVQRTTDFLEKSTWTLAVALFVLCLASASFNNTIINDVDTRFQEKPLEQPQQPEGGAVEE